MLHKYIPCHWSTAAIEVVAMAGGTKRFITLTIAFVIRIDSIFLFAVHVIVVQPSGSFMRILAQMTDSVSSVITGTNTYFQSDSKVL